MVKTYTHRNLAWIDAETPTKDEVSILVKKYALHPLVGEELLSPSRKPRIDVYKNYLFLALQIPIRSKVGGRYVVVEKEVDFVIGSNFIITSRNEVVEPLHSFSRVFETNSILDKSGVGEHAGIIFYYMLKKIYGHMRSDLENIRDSLSLVEKHIFLGHERDMVEGLSELSREIIDFKQTARHHKEMFESFEDVPRGFFDDDFQSFMDDLKAEYAAVHDLVTNNRELLNDLRDTNDSLLSTKQNEHLKLFSILAFITFPLSLLLDIFSLPTENTPIIGSAYDWEILTGIVIILTVSMFYYFKKKGWI
ncbi:MAG: CorA family divalent cation transporter [Patescibacteria group bacterium]